MSHEKNRAEALRWFATAEGDLTTASLLKENGRFAHACFHAHQAAEKAVKALWYFADADPWGHSVKKLVQDLKDVDGRLYESIASAAASGMFLDRFYIPTRYPNGLPDITPDEAFTGDDAHVCLERAREVVETVRSVLF